MLRKIIIAREDMENKPARSDWLLSGHCFLVMTGHYEFFFQGVIKTKIVSLLRNCFYCPFWFRSHGQGFLCLVIMTWNDLLRPLVNVC